MMPKDRQTVLVKCRIHRGAFDGERSIAPPGYTATVVPVGYCHFSDGSPITKDDPLSGGEILGLVTGIEFDRLPNGSSRVELPDGEPYEVEQRHIVRLKVNVTLEYPSC